MEKRLEIVSSHNSLSKEGVYIIMLIVSVWNVFLTSCPILPAVHHHADALCHRSDLSHF